MSEFKWITDGSVTSVPGFKACGVTAGFKRSGAPDFAMIFSETPADFAGVFTSCTFAAAPVRYDRELVKKGGKLQAAVINSGNANACTGCQGMKNAAATAEFAGKALGISPDLVAVASTGRIGVQLPMDIIQNGITLGTAALSDRGGNDAALCNT